MKTFDEAPPLVMDVESTDVDKVAEWTRGAQEEVEYLRQAVRSALSERQARMTDAESHESLGRYAAFRVFEVMF